MSNNNKHPLDKEFDVHMENLIDGDDKVIDIPDEKELRDLDLIIDLALRTYKEQMEDIQFIEPKNRIKYLEIAERFLNQAKDAMAKRDKLKLDGKKLSKNPNKAPTSDDEEDKVPSEGISRKDLQARMKVVR